MTECQTWAGTDRFRSKFVVGPPNLLPGLSEQGAQASLPTFKRWRNDPGGFFHIPVGDSSQCPLKPTAQARSFSDPPPIMPRSRAQQVMEPGRVSTPEDRRRPPKASQKILQTRPPFKGLPARRVRGRTEQGNAVCTILSAGNPRIASTSPAGT